MKLLVKYFAWNNYGIPEWMTSNDNVICISYSGNTAETLSAAKKAHEMGCKIEIITTGGKLGDLADKTIGKKLLLKVDINPVQHYLFF